MVYSTMIKIKTFSTRPSVVWADNLQVPIIVVIQDISEWKMCFTVSLSYTTCSQLLLQACAYCQQLVAIGLVLGP